jgi:hypothetical protein
MMRQATMFDCVFLYVLPVRARSRTCGLDLLRANAICFKSSAHNLVNVLGNCTRRPANALVRSSVGIDVQGAVHLRAHGPESAHAVSPWPQVALPR